MLKSFNGTIAANKEPLFIHGDCFYWLITRICHAKCAYCCDVITITISKLIFMIKYSLVVYGVNGLEK